MTKRKQKDEEFVPPWADEMELSQDKYNALMDGIKQLITTGEIFENEQQEILEPISRKNIRH